MIEDLKEDINNSRKERQENTGKQVEALKEETHKFLKKCRKTQTGEGIEQNLQEYKKGNRNNKEITRGGNPGNGKPRKAIRGYRCKHHQ
jgi:glutamyl-tRNA reductase